MFQLLKSTATEWYNDKALRLSAAIAYYSIFSIAPLLVIAVSMAGLVFGPDAVRGHLDDQLTSVMSPAAAKTIQEMVQSASSPTDGLLGTIIGGAVLLIGASGVFGQLKDSLNTIWEVKPKPGGSGIMGFIRDYLLNFGMVLVVGFLLLTSLVLTTAMAAFSNYLDRAFQLPPLIWSGAAFLISFGMVTLLFAFIFKVLPDAQIQWRDVWIGAAATAALFEVGKFALGWYLGRESTTSSYGAAGAVVLVLLWVYYASCILFFGAEFTQVYARRHGRYVPPAENAQPVTAEERVNEGMTPPSKPDNQRFDPGSTVATPPVFIPAPQLTMQPLAVAKTAPPVQSGLPGAHPVAPALKLAFASVLSRAIVEVIDQGTKRLRKKLKRKVS